MSKSSTATLPKIPTQLPQKSAWAKGPPQNSTVPSPRSQSPAPQSPVNAPHLTHSRRASALGQGVPIKDGVSIPRNNVGAVKQGSAVTFGSIDDVSAPISSSPAATPAIKSEGVKSFGSVPATASSIGHVNGKASISKPATASTSASASTSSTPPPSTPATTPARIKMDVRMFFQSPSTPAPPSDPPSSSPSIRPSPLPQQQQPPPQNPSQPSQLGAHSYTTFVPQNGIRPPSQQNPGSGGSGGPRSPVYPRQQMANGNGPRPPNGPNGPGGPSSGMGSPRMSQHPGQPGMPPQMPPQMPSQMQPGMQPGMPPQMWPGQYYYPGMPPEQQQYMSYQAGWYGMPPAAQHPGMHPQHQPQQMQHHAPPPVQQQHQSMPMSPRNHPIPMNSGPGTPIPAHAVPSAHHVPPPLSQHHSSSSSAGGVSTPPPTPSSARLNTNASTFVPGGPRKAKVVLKSAEGVEINLESLKQLPNAPSAASAVTSPPMSAPVASGSPGHNNRKSVQIRMESEEARKKRIAEEEEKEKEKAKAKAEAEEKERKAKEEAEKERLRKEEEEKEKIRLEEERKRKEEEEEKERVRLEEQRRKEEAEAKAKAEAEEKERKEKEEKERLRKEEEEKERVKRAEEEAQLKKEQEEAAAAAAAAAASSTITEGPASISEEEGEVQEISVKSKEDEDDNLPTPIKEKQDAPLRIDTVSSTPVEFPRRRPGPLDLSTTFKPNIPAALPSALATARIIDDLSRVSYPENIQSPKVELNINAKDGKFRYDRDFLLQFMSICKEKPDMLPPLDAIGIGPVDQNSMTRTNSRGGTHRAARTPSISGPPGGGNAPGFPGFGPKAVPSGGMGNFVPGPKLSSEERYAISSGQRAASVSGAMGSPFNNRMPTMIRSTSQGGPGSQLGGSKRTRSKRGEARDKNQGSQLAQGSNARDNQSIFENPPPLQVTANRWDRKTVGAVDPDSPELVDRKVKALLNKLTMEKFDSISDQIIEWANKSEKEKDGRTLIQVIRLVFEKATDEATWSEMYARLCRKMMEQISPKVQDDGIKNAEGKPIAGGQLFRKYLLNRCQEDFERGWVAKEATAAAAATKAMEDKAAKAANEKNTEAAAAGEQGDEIVLYSDEYYAAQKAKRQGLGLIKFIGELFKLQMLTERIMHECVKKLLGNVENPEEEEIESLCKLISTVGLLLDTPKARAHMDVYFSRMKELGKSNNVSSRMQFMLQDVIELRERKWVARTQVAAPTTIAGVHEAAAKDRANQEKESYQRTMSMSRGGSRRGGERDFPGPGPDGWTNVAGSNTPRPPPKAGDLSNFGKIASNKGLPMTFGPSSVFSGKKDSKRESLSRASSNSNMFSMLSQSGDAPVEAAPKPAPEAPAQRRRLILQPRSKPTEEQGTATAEATPAGSAENSEDEDGGAPEMSEEDADKKIAEDSKEFFAVRNLDEAEVYFSALPAVHHHRLVEKLVGTAVEGKEVNAQLVAELLTRAVSKELCSVDALEEGFSPLVEILEDIAIDAPKAPTNMALMMKAASFDSDRTARIAAKSMEPDNLLALLS